MSNAALLTDQVKAALQQISTANGYNTNLTGIYLFGENKADSVPPAYLLVRVASDEMLSFMGNCALRAVTYEIEGVISRTGTLQDLQRLHRDILKALGLGKLPASRPLASGWPFEESAEFEPDQGGSATRRVTSSVTLHYAEKY
jgi:hypothetical protein